MAAISKALGTSLDALRQTILEAESYLEKCPGVSRLSGVTVVDLEKETDSFAYEIAFEEFDGTSTILLQKWNIVTGDLEDAKPLRDLPVAVRLTAAKMIPSLIAAADEAGDSLQPEVDATIEAIKKAMKK